MNRVMSSHYTYIHLDKNALGDVGTGLSHNAEPSFYDRFFTVILLFMSHNFCGFLEWTIRLYICVSSNVPKDYLQVLNYWDMRNTVIITHYYLKEIK